MTIGVQITFDPNHEQVNSLNYRIYNNTGTQETHSQSPSVRSDIIRNTFYIFKYLIIALPLAKKVIIHIN